MHHGSLWRKLAIGGAIATGLVGLLLAFVVLFGDRPDSYHWEKVSPETQGMSTARLDALLEGLITRDTTAFLVVKNDFIVYEWYQQENIINITRSNVKTLLREKSISSVATLMKEVVPVWEDQHYQRKRHNLGAMVKYLVSGMAVVVAEQEGVIKLDDPAWKYIPEWENDPQRSQITIRHLVTQTSGIENVRFPYEVEGWKGDFSRDVGARFPLSVTVAPVVSLPGSRYVYSSTGFYALHYALAVAMRDTTQPDLRELLKTRIMDPLGVPEEDWVIGYEEGETYSLDGLELYPPAGAFSARAVARVAQLLVHSGNWQGQQLLDQELVGTMLSYAASPDLERPEDTPGPGVGGWTNFDGLWPMLPKDAFVAAGANHKFLLIVPSQDLIVVRFGGSLVEDGVWTEEGGEYFESLETYMLNPLMDAIVRESAFVDEN